MYNNAAHNNIHFYYTPSNRRLLVDITNGSRAQGTYTLPSGNDIIDIVYTADAVYVNGNRFDHNAYTASAIQIGSEEGSTRTTSTVVKAEVNPDSLPDFGTRDSFTMSEVTSDNICQNYYSESDDPGKGLWRVPNEKEFAMMFSIQQNYGISILKSYASSRTTFYRDPDIYTGANDSGDSIFWLTPSSMITTSKNDKPANIYVRCVRDNY